MEDVSLVEVDGDKGLKLATVNLGQILGGHLDEGVKNLLKMIICGLHDLTVSPGVLEGFSCTGCPNDLDT